jgi:hypothetical protein
MRNWILLLFVSFFAPQCDRAEENTATHGTLISVFGNQNGLVVVTDSMATSTDPSGQVHHTPHAQKLLKYNDRTVCAIAGLGTVVVPAAPNLNSAILGIISSYRDEVKAKDIREPIKSALSGISVLLRYYLESVAEINAVTGHTGEISNYYLEVLMVGFDIDGPAKIGELTLFVERNAAESGQTRWKASELQNEVRVVDKELTHSLKGKRGIAEQVLATSEVSSGYEILKTYAAALKSDKGASLKLAQMEEVQRVIFNLTADVDKEVGGDKQVAVLKDGHISYFDQPGFPEPHRPFGLAIFHGGHFSGTSFDDGARGLGMNEGSGHGSGLSGVVIRGNVVKFFDSVHFDSVGAFPGVPLLLDGNVFVKCVFENTNVIYYGGSLYLDGTNQVINSHVLWGSNSDRRPDIINTILERHFLN